LPEYTRLLLAISGHTLYQKLFIYCRYCNIVSYDFSIYNNSQ